MTRKNHSRNKMDKRVAFEGQPAPSLYGPGGARKYLNLEERRRVLSSVATLPPHQALFVLTLAWTGARISEVLQLRRSSFQQERGIVSVTTLKRRRLHVRELPIPTELMNSLDRHFEWRTMGEEPLANSRLWPWHRTTAWRLVKTVMIEARVTGRPACPRGLRHGFGVGMLQVGVPINLVQRWLGHARLSTTAIYADASGPEERRFAQQFWSC